MSNQYSLRPSSEGSPIENIICEAKKGNKTLRKPRDVGPDDKAPVLFMKDGQLRQEFMTWGFPNFRNDGPIYAARAETIDERSTFHRSVLERRCIIPTTGFYERVYSGTKEGRYRFNLLNTEELYMAGIYNGYKNDKGREEYYFAMLTTDANDSLDGYNERMPVVLRKNEFNTWLNGNYEKLYDRNSIKLKNKKLS